MIDILVRRYHDQYLIVRPVVEGIHHEEAWMDAEEYRSFVQEMCDTLENLERRIDP